MHVRPGVPYVEAPDLCFTGNGYSELLASGFKFEIKGKRVDISIPKSIPFTERQIWLERFKQIGFDGVEQFDTAVGKTGDSVEVTIVVG